MTKTRIIVSGPRGRMGQALLRLAGADEGLQIVAALDRSNAADAAAKDGIRVVSSLKAVGEPGGAVLIEFTNPEATLEHLRAAAEMGINAVVGTTGFSAEEREEVDNYAEKIGLVVAANTSLGVNVLLGVVEQLARTLHGYDIELVEMHHRLKKDAPSGTAVALAEAAARGRDVMLADVARHGREGLVGERPRGEIGMHSLRGGDVVGEHTITFAGPGERVEVVHRAHSRDTFAAGALLAARWLAGKAPGLYTMRDVLGVG